MIERAAFAEGLARLAVASRQPLDDPTLDVYYQALHDQTNPPEWQEFTRDMVHEGAFEFFPKMRELLDALFSWRMGEKQPERPALMEHRPTPDERQRNRERGLAVFRAELKRLGVPDPTIPERVVTAPSAERTGGMSKAAAELLRQLEGR